MFNKGSMYKDEFEGKSWLNILAAITFIGGIFFPFIAGNIGMANIPEWCLIAAWFVFVLVVTLIIASAAQTQERLARIEKHLGFKRGYADAIAEKSEQEDEAENNKEV
ncbi:MAG: hypothetical protein JXA96_08170 [Sedimentisphaerales bacterium]|nr:hypothetical protein [Sedimentisphaerales bacterium]